MATNWWKSTTIQKTTWNENFDVLCRNVRWAKNAPGQPPISAIR